MKTIILIAALILFNIRLFSQANQEWLQRYNGPNNGTDKANDMAMDAAGNIYVTGTSEYDYVTVKYNSSGVQQWTARYHGSYHQYNEAFAVTVDNAGNVYVTGENGSSSTNADIVTVKYTSSGIQVWAVRSTFAGDFNDAGYSIAVDAAGNVYVAGSMRVNSTTGRDFTTIKYASNGNILWMINYNRQGASNDQANKLVLDASGNIYVTGTTNIPNTSFGTDITTIKYNPAGVQQWIMHYNPNGLADAPSSIILDNQGSVIVAGASTGTGPALVDFITIKYDNNGSQQWASRYNYQNFNDAINDVTVDVSGNVYVTGVSNSTPNDYDYATIKYNPSGVQQWVQRYTTAGPDRDEAYAIAVDGSGNVYITGQAAVSTSDYLTIKYNSSGVQQWLAIYNGTGNAGDGAVDIELDASGNLYITGFSIGSGTSYDYSTIKYSQLTGIEQVTNEILDKFSISQNYPNPFNPMTKIKFSIPEAANVSIKVFDVQGKHITSLVNERLNAGIFETEWNAANMPSGTYFYRIEADGISETNKMILIK